MPVDLLASASTSGPGSTGSFPALSANAIDGPSPEFVKSILSMTQQQLQANPAYDISSTDISFYTTKGKANAAAVWLAWYVSLNERDRQTVQDTMVDAGLLPDTAATGINNSTALTAFKGVIGQAAEMTQGGTNSTPLSLLAATGTGIEGIQNQISAGETKAEGVIQQPIVSATAVPTATLNQAIVQAFNQNTGFTPSQAQINQFVSSVTGQEKAAAEAPRAEAEAELTQFHSEQSALNQLGPNGIDGFLSAYQKAVGTTGTQGPQIGTTGAGQQITPAATAEVPGTFRPGATTTTTRPELPGVLSGIAHNIVNTVTNPLGAIRGQGFEQMGVPTPTQVTTTGRPTDQITNTAATFTSSQPAYGGTYSLSLKEWHAAQAMTPAAQKYASAGQAPQSVQLAALTNLGDSLFKQYGSWYSVAVALSGGDPSKVTGTANGTKTARQTFAEGVANSVNQQVESIQNNVNAGSVTLKPETPTSQDISAAAAQQSKEDNPVGYYAANAATWGSFLTKALYGNPLEEMQPTTTFAGPVGSAAQTSESAAGNVAATAAATGT